MRRVTLHFCTRRRENVHGSYLASRPGSRTRLGRGCGGEGGEA